jgi:hypothetical protein
MLYTRIMNKPIFPEAVQPGRQYSWRADLKLNAWAFVAMLAAGMARWVLQHHQGWGLGLRSIIALTPLVPSLLYVQSIARWIGGMDELQRRIQLEACLFATTATVFVVTALSLLHGTGVLQSVRLQNGLGWEGTFAAIIGFYVLGNMLVNRRYR